MKKKIAIFCCLLLLGLTACSSNSTTTTVEEKEEEQEMIEHAIAMDNYIVVDVRTKEEYAESHIKDAWNIPYDKIDETTSLPKEKAILVYCKSGKRSAEAYKKLNDLGYEVYDLGAFDSITFLEKE